MERNAINEFMSDLRYNGGPEKEFAYEDRYIIQADGKEDDEKTYFRLVEEDRSQ